MDFDRVDAHLYQNEPGRIEGSKSYLKDLVKILHDNGLKVILDMVVNHTGYHNSTYQHYPHKVFEPEHFNPANSQGEKESWLAGLPDLDHDNSYVVDYFVNNVLSWIEEASIDGIRMDTAKHVEAKFWYYFKAAIKTYYPQITLIGEVLKEGMDDIPDLANYQKSYNFDSVFDFPLRRKMLDVFIHDLPLTELARPRISSNEKQGVLDKDREYTNPFRLVTLLDNHDMSERVYTAILDKVGHGNRNKAVAIMKLLLSFLFTTRGIPQLYYGNEISMEGRKDPDNRRNFPWDYFQSNLEFSHQAPDDSQAVFHHTQTLIELRKKHPALSCGYLITLWADKFVYIYARIFQDDIAIVALNNGHQDMPFPLPVPILSNSNLPPRVKHMISSPTLADAIDSDYQTQSTPDGLPIQILGKTARILLLQR